jgi:hypothetical protein
MALLIEENLLEDVLAVVEQASRRENTVEEEAEYKEYEEALAVEEEDPTESESEFAELNSNALQESMKALSIQSPELDNETEPETETTTAPVQVEVQVEVEQIRILETQDSTQKLQSGDCYSEQRHIQPRRSRRRQRRRSIKDSLTSLFSSSSQHQKRENNSSSNNNNNSNAYTNTKSKRAPSPRDMQRSTRERSQVFSSLTSLVSKRRTVNRRKKNGRRRFSAMSHEFGLLLRSSDKMDMNRRKSMPLRQSPLRQSSSTAFTSAAFEVSHAFRAEDLAGDREEDTEEELSSPFGRNHAIY